MAGIKLAANTAYAWQGLETFLLVNTALMFGWGHLEKTARYLTVFRFPLWEKDICGNKTLSTDRLLASVTLTDQPRQSMSSSNTIL